MDERHPRRGQNDVELRLCRPADRNRAAGNGGLAFFRRATRLGCRESTFHERFQSQRLRAAAVPQRLGGQRSILSSRHTPCAVGGGVRQPPGCIELDKAPPTLAVYCVLSTQYLVPA